MCPTEIIAFSERKKDFSDLNAEVVGVSVDSHFSHLAWTNTERKVIQLINPLLYVILSTNLIINFSLEVWEN